METAFRSVMRRYILPLVLLIAACATPSEPGSGDSYPPEAASDATQFIASERSAQPTIATSAYDAQLTHRSVRIDPKR